jgi:multisubunit Na+/H+ antiporter MnhG subunit
MTTLLLLLLASGLVVLLLDGNWRDGLLLSVLVGFLQDPIRKLTPGQPGLYVGLVLIAVACCALNRLNRLTRIKLKSQGALELIKFPYGDD